MIFIHWRSKGRFGVRKVEKGVKCSSEVQPCFAISSHIIIRETRGNYEEAFVALVLCSPPVFFLRDLTPCPLSLKERGSSGERGRSPLLILSPS